MTAREIATALNLTTQAVYYHLAKMAEAKK